MARTMAIGSAEAKGRRYSAQIRSQYFRPQAFAVMEIVADPGRHQAGMRSQIIDVPMWPQHRSAVMGQACRCTTRSKGTADINRPAGFQLQPIASPNCDFRSFIDTKPQRIGSWLGGGFRQWSGHFNTLVLNLRSDTSIGEQLHQHCVLHPSIDDVRRFDTTAYRIQRAGNLG